MGAESEKITIDKQTLIQAVLEWEQQEALKTEVLRECLSQLHQVTERVEQALLEDNSIQTKTALFNLFVSDSGWRLLLTDEQLDSWKTKVIGDLR